MSIKIFETSDAPSPIGPYSQSIEYDGLVFCSGQIPIDPKTKAIIAKDIKGQTKQVMENIRAVLMSAGLDFQNIIKTTIFLTSIEDAETMNKVYAEYFSAPLWPVRSCVQVAKLPQGAKIEIEVLASRYPVQNK